MFNTFTMFKFALFLVVAVVAVQGVQPRSEELSRFETNGIINVIQEIVEKIRDFVSNNLGDLVKNLADKIKQMIENIEKIITEFKEKIEEFVRKYGAPAIKCYKQLKPELDAIVQATRSGLMACARKAHEKLVTIKGDVADVAEKVRDWEDDVKERVLKCVLQSQGNIPAMRKCLQAQYDVILEEFEQLKKEVLATVEVIEGVVVEAKADLNKCYNEVKEKVSEMQLEFADRFSKCIADNQ